MALKVLIPFPLRRYTGGASLVELEASTVQGVIDALDLRFPGSRSGICEAAGTLRRFINIYLDGEDVRFLDNLATPVYDAAEVAIVPAIAGGSSDIGGNQCLIVTPLKEDESVDEESTRNLVDFVIQQGVHGILVHGSTGEGFLFDTDERKAFLDLVVKYAKGRVPVGFCVESSATSISVELSKYASRSGADYLFTTAPYRHPHKGDGIFAHFKAINDATDLPVSIYDGGAGVELGLDLLEKISNELERIKYCKIFLEKPEKIEQIFRRTKGRIIPWAGHDRLTYLMLCYGAYGMTSAASCILPRENSKMFDLVKAGHLEEARAIYLSKVCPLNAMAFFSVLDFIAAYKLALHWMGVIKSPTVRKPLLQLDATMQRELRGALQFIGKL
jgi:4-hydroxy-tetrahydrodipicolinate synthase